MNLINQIGIDGIVDIFARFGINIKVDDDGFFYESYNWHTEETCYHYIDVYSDIEIANRLNISISVLYEEAQSCLAA